MHLSVSMYQWSSHMSQLLRNNWVTGGKHTCSPFPSPTTFSHVQDSAKCHAGRSTKQSKTHDVGYPDIHRPGYVITLVADMRQSITNHHVDLNMVMMMTHISYVTVIKQRMFVSGREVDNPLISLLSAGSPSDADNVLCDIYDLSMKTR